MLGNKEEKYQAIFNRAHSEYKGKIITVLISLFLSADVEIFEQVIFKGRNTNGQKIAIQ